VGYTHYWTQLRDFKREEWADVVADIGAILTHVQTVEGVPLADGSGEEGTKPEIDVNRVWFNGNGYDDSHETFGIYRVRPPKESWQTTRGNDFCKTARKPYDVAVTACLCYLATITETHRVTSDGYGYEWLPGLQVARAALPRYANRLDIPRPILESNRWTGPHLWTESKHYDLKFCIDGHAYVIRHKDGEAYRFASHDEAKAWVAKHRHIVDPTGVFDAERKRRLAREQTRLYRQLVEAAETIYPNRRVRPPAYVRL
jgi:hypothetical protein